MNVLSLFDGMSCGQIALNRIGKTPTKYYAAEIDKYAIEVTQANYPDTIQLGSVLDWQSWDIDWASIDLVTGGFPCQAWSVAGKQQGDKDERGMLFWTMLDIMKTVMAHNSNAYFLIENVKMKKDFEQYITYHTEQALGLVHKHLINSALVSAQNRNRYYWTNIEGVTQPEDKGLVLRDVLEDADTDREKSYCLDANYHKGASVEQYESKCRRQLIMVGHASDIKGHDANKRVYSADGLAPTLTTMGGGHREPKVAIRTKSKCVRSSGLGSYDRHEWDSISDCHYRKLTPLECERLQTVPDNYTNHVSNTQRYKMIGNGWTVDVIAHILRFAKWATH